MNCAQCEKLIYLYSELSPSERSELAKHVADCSGCKQLLMQFQQFQKEKTKIFTTPMLEYPDVLTARVMSRVNEEKKTAGIGGFFKGILHAPTLRHSMALLSFALLLIFFFEFNAESGFQPPVAPHSKSDVILHSAQFFQQLKDEKNDYTSSFSACLKTCFESQQNEDCRDCRIKIINNKSI